MMYQVSKNWFSGLKISSYGNFMLEFSLKLSHFFIYSLVFNTRRVSIVRGEGGWKFFENLIGEGRVIKRGGRVGFCSKI